MTRIKTAAARLWRAYIDATRHKHAYDDRGQCRGCGRIIGDW